MDAMDLIGLSSGEVNVQSRKSKAITKADLPALSGHEVQKMLEGRRQLVLDAAIPASHAGRVKILAVCEKYDGTSTTLSADPGGLTADGLAAAKKLWTATEMFFAAFKDTATAHDITPYMHEDACHFPRWMELHGNLDALSAQCMEHCNMEIKESFRKGNNHQPQRLLKSGKPVLTIVGATCPTTASYVYPKDKFALRGS
eukprot:jgi/Tetstr1/423584/TSEL_014256.t1